MLLPPCFAVTQRGAAGSQLLLGQRGKAGGLFALPEELRMRGELVKSTVSFSLHLCVWHY